MSFGLVCFVWFCWSSFSITPSTFVSVAIVLFDFAANLHAYHPARAPFSSDIQNCGLDCLADDAFHFVGASEVDTVNIQQNPFVTLPEKLLWGMNSSLVYFYARNLVKLTGLPGKFFFDQPQLMLIFFTGTTRVGVAQPLPDELLRGLTGLVYLSLMGCAFQNLPNLDDLTVRAGGPVGVLASCCGQLYRAFVCVSFQYLFLQSSTFLKSFWYRELITLFFTLRYPKCRSSKTFG